MRTSAVCFAKDWGLSSRRAARELHLSARTLTKWRERSVKGTLAAVPRGRPVTEASSEHQLAVAEVLDECGATVNLASLRKACPAIRPAILAELRHDHRRQLLAQKLRASHTLTWISANTVWAIDHSVPPGMIDGRYPFILSARDLASGMQLAWTPVEDATTQTTLKVLQYLITIHAAPLVIKSDNGSAFTSHAFRNWLDAHDILPLLSPVRMPQYNGACEAGIGAAKRRTEVIAERHGRALCWSASDLDAALQWGNEESYPGGFAAGTPAARFAGRIKITEAARSTFRRAVIKYRAELLHELCGTQPPGDQMNALLSRRAVREALVDLNYLVISRRPFPQPFNSTKCATIK